MPYGVPKTVESWFMRKLFIALAAGLAGVVVLISTSAELLGPSISVSLWNPMSPPDNQRCLSSRPIAVTIRNYGFSRIARVNYDLEIWIDGRAKDVLHGSSRHLFDKAISPFSAETICLTDPLIEAMRGEKPSTESSNRFDLRESVERSNRFLETYVSFRERATTSAQIISTEHR